MLPTIPSYSDQYWNKGEDISDILVIVCGILIYTGAIEKRDDTQKISFRHVFDEIVEKWEDVPARIILSQCRGKCPRADLA